VSSVAETLAEGTALLRHSSDSPRADALLLLEHALAQKPAWVVAHGDAIVPLEAGAAFRSSCDRRKTGVPAAYILNSAGFYGREFIVNESVLIPRPETEHLIDEAVAFLPTGPCDVLDVGTGSGAIACTIAAETRARVSATDVCGSALEIAAENARRLGVTSRCSFHRGDLTGPLRGRGFELVVANLPYIPTAELPEPPDPVSFEPRTALDGGQDGLQLYRRLLPQLPSLLNSNAMVLLEAAPPTIPGLLAIVRSSLPKFTTGVCKDYAGLPRYIKAKGPAA
jgi:release factor glutamine methyltransferase